MLEQAFWKNKLLEELNPEEWEALCDRCGICCLVKAEDEDGGDVYTTNIICENYDCVGRQCSFYQERQQRVSHCTQLTPSLVEQFDWLPESCAYRLVLNKKPLPLTHPLLHSHEQPKITVVELLDNFGLVKNHPELDIEDHIIEDMADYLL